MSGRPSLSFVIAAYNAEAIVSTNLASLLAQSREDWEAVVVDDGSVDGTAEVVAEMARLDGRIRLVRQANGGVSAARNAGVAVARSDLVCLIDADDWVDPRYVELMVAALAGRDRTAVAYCWFRRVAPNGSLFPVKRMRDLAADPVSVFANNCVCSPNCLVFAREVYAEVGGMDPSLRTCEDWDLWIRLARSGASFVGVPHCLAFYRVTDGSLTLQSDLSPLLRDGLTVLDRASKPDSRLPRVLPECSDGIRFEHDLTATFLAVWCAGMQAVAGQDPDNLIALLPAVPDLRGREEAVAGTLIEGLRLGCREFANSTVRNRSEAWRGPVERLFDILQDASPPELKQRLWLCTLRFLARRDHPPAEPWKVGSVFAVRVDVANIAPVYPPKGCTCGVLVFTDHGISLAAGEVSVRGPVIAPRTIAEVAAEALSARRLLLLGVRKIGSPDVRRLLALRARRIIPYWRKSAGPCGRGGGRPSSPQALTGGRSPRPPGADGRPRGQADMAPPAKMTRTNRGGTASDEQCGRRQAPANNAAPRV